MAVIPMRKPSIRASTRSVAFSGLPAIGGRSLERFVAERCLTMRERVALLREICTMVRQQQDPRAVTRNCPGAQLSPRSLWVTSEGKPTPLADAGAVVVDPAFLSPRLRVGRVAGIAAAGTGPDAVTVIETDQVHALGALLWWFVTERSPGALGEQAAHAQRATHSPYRRELAEIARCAMAAGPHTRYGTVSEFDAELARWQAKRPVAAVGRHWRYRARKWLDRREHSLPLAAIAGGVFLAALLLAGS